MKRALVAAGLAMILSVGTVIAQDAEALLAESYAYRDGIDVPRDFARARALVRRASEMGLPAAEAEYGRYLFAGRGGARDVEQGLALLERAAETGDGPILFDLASALQTARPERGERIAELYAQAVDAGHLSALTSLAVLYQDGIGVAQDLPRAETLYRRAIAGGDVRAMNNLGTLIARQADGAADQIEARRLFEAAAQTGFEPAMRNLSVMLENGYGGPVDERRATALARAASNDFLAQTAYPLDPRLTVDPDAPGFAAAQIGLAGRGDPVARYLVGWLWLNGLLPSEAPDMPMAHLKSAADAGHPGAALLIGLAYFEGRGVPQDFVLGEMWLSLARAMAGRDLSLDIPDTGDRLTPEQLAEAQELASGRWADHTGAADTVAPR